MCEYKHTHKYIHLHTQTYIYTHIHIVLFNILIILSLQYRGLMSKKQNKTWFRANNHIFSLELNFLVFYASLPDMSFLLHHANPYIRLQPSHLNILSTP